MSKMVSRYVQVSGFQSGAEIQGYINSKGEIKYNFVDWRGRNCGDCTKEKDEIINRFKMECKFNEENEAREELNLLGFIL